MEPKRNLLLNELLHTEQWKEELSREQKYKLAAGNRAREKEKTPVKKIKLPPHSQQLKLF